MDENMRKQTKPKPSATGPISASDLPAVTARAQTTPPPPDGTTLDAEAMKSQILHSLKADIAEIIQREMKNALAEDFNHLKSELQAVKAEITTNMAAVRTEVDQVKSTLAEVENGLSTWSDEVSALQVAVSGLKTEVVGLRDKCDDMEGRMRRCNVRILDVPETNGSCSTASITKLLREALGLDRDVLVDRAHRALGPRRSDGKPRAIIAKLHYFQDCVDVLSRARTRAPLRADGQTIAIYPDYAAGVARARAAFTEVRKLLRDRQGVRYGILFPARLRITHNGEDREFTDAGKAMDYVKKKVLSAATVG